MLSTTRSRVGDSMSRSSRLIACALLGASPSRRSSPSRSRAHAQDMTTATFGGRPCLARRRFAVPFPSGHPLHLPLQGRVATPSEEQRERLVDDFGGAAGGGFETALGFWGDYRVTAASRASGPSRHRRQQGLQRRYRSLRRLRSGDRNGFQQLDPPHQDRPTADYWGTQAESKFGRARAGAHQTESVPE